MNHSAQVFRTPSELATRPARRTTLPRALNVLTAIGLVLAVSLSAGSARAAPVTYTGSVSSPQGSSFPCLSPAHAGDGSGLSINIVDGVTPWTTTSTALHINAGCTFGMATATQGLLHYTLDLGTARSIDMLGFWGIDVGGANNPLLYNFKLTADNLPAWGDPMATPLGAFTAAGSQLGNTGMVSFAFNGPVTARYLHLDFPNAVASVFIGDLAAREAAPVPEPGSLVLAGLGLAVLGARRRRPRPGRAPLAAAALLASAMLPAQAGYVTWTPSDPYTLVPAGLPTVLGNHGAGGTPTGNPNQVKAQSTLGPITSVSLHTHDDPNPAFAEVEYELVWTVTNPFAGMPMYSITFWTQTFGNLLQYDGGPTGTVLDSTPWASQGMLVAGSWTAAGMVFDMGPGGLPGGQSATFYLPLDVIGLGDGSSAASNVMAQGFFDPLPPNAVPEPGSLALAGLSLAALALAQRRRAR